MIKQLAAGRLASEVFRELMQADASLTGREISRLVVAEFPEVNGAVVQIIRRWKGFGHRDEVSDADLNLAIVQFLREAGYMRNPD
ncbi:hypothetical protein [Ralstonia pseudosolanacearum]